MTENTSEDRNSSLLGRLRNRATAGLATVGLAATLFTGCGDSPNQSSATSHAKAPVPVQVDKEAVRFSEDLRRGIFNVYAKAHMTPTQTNVCEFVHNLYQHAPNRNDLKVTEEALFARSDYIKALKALAEGRNPTANAPATLTPEDLTAIFGSLLVMAIKHNESGAMVDIIYYYPPSAVIGFRRDTHHEKPKIFVEFLEREKGPDEAKAFLAAAREHAAAKEAARERAAARQKARQKQTPHSRVNSSGTTNHVAH